MLKNKRALVIALAVWQALCFSLMGVLVRMMSDSFTTYQQVFWRILIAAVGCWLIFGNRFKKSTFQQLKVADWLTYAIRAFLNYGVGVLLFTVAVLHADLAQVSFISSLPIVGLIAWILFKEKIDSKALPLILLSVIGLAFVSGLSSTSGHLTLGTVAAIASMLGFDISYLMVRYHPKSMSNFHNTTLMLTFAWIPPLVLLLTTHEQIIPTSISALALVGFIVSVVLNISGLYFLNIVFNNLKGYVAGNILLLEGVFALIFGGLIYGEKLNIIEFIGAAIIVCCAVLLSRISLRQEESLGVEM